MIAIFLIIGLILFTLVIYIEVKKERPEILNENDFEIKEIW